MKTLILAGLASAVTPVQKVVQMLEDMSATGQQRMEAEQVSFAKFSTFCDNEQRVKADEIKKANQSIESLQASILKANTDADDRGAEIASLNKDISKYEADVKAQKANRVSTHKEYQAEHKDLGESVDALARAITILKRQHFDRKQAASFIQRESGIPDRAKQLIADFMAIKDDDDGDFMDRSAPEAHGYENQSGGIIEMLKKLQTDFKKQAHECDTAETNSRQAFEMAMQDLTASIADSNESVEKKTVQRQKRLGNAAKAEKELAATTASRDSDVQYLSDLKVECTEKSKSFTEKQQLAQDELEALGEAIRILGGDDVSGNASKHLPGLVQKGNSFVQIRSAGAPIDNKVVNFLSSEGKRLKSDKLALLASKIAADPFLKVKKMIKEMVNRLMKEQNEEAQTKGFCDKELKTNKMTRDRLAAEMDQLHAEFDEQSAMAQQFGSKIQQLSEEIAELDTAVKEATEQRVAEKTKNAETVKDAKAAQQAVASATNVLRSFYEKAGQATAFVQVPKMGSDEWQALANPAFKGEGGYGQGSEDKVDKGHKAGMQTFGDQYTGQQDSASGVLGMLEVIMSDFANLEAETTASEAAAAKEYERFMVDSKRDKAVKTKQVEMSQVDREQAEHNAAQAKRDLSTTDDQARAADRYYENLKPKCVDEGVSFEERDAARKEEIESLKEALQMLQPQD